MSLAPSWCIAVEPANRRPSLRCSTRRVPHWPAQLRAQPRASVEQKRLACAALIAYAVAHQLFATLLTASLALPIPPVARGLELRWLVPKECGVQLLALDQDHQARRGGVHGRQCRPNGIDHIHHICASAISADVDDDEARPLSVDQRRKGSVIESIEVLERRARNSAASLGKARPRA
eukprot:6669496-Prymnesium_polylepis.1